MAAPGSARTSSSPKPLPRRVSCASATGRTRCIAKRSPASSSRATPEIGGGTSMPGKPIEKGATLVTPGRTIGEGDVNLFAGLVGDFTPVHVDEVFAKSTPFGPRIAHGPLPMATAIGMLPHTGSLGERVTGLVHLNWDCPGPGTHGDNIR